MYCLLRHYKEETQLVGLLFTKGVLEFVVKILDKCTYKEFQKFLFKIEIVNLRIAASNNGCIHIPEEILKRNTSLFWVLAVSQEKK